MNKINLQKTIVLILAFLLLALPVISCSTSSEDQTITKTNIPLESQMNTKTSSNKISSLLQLQINLRKAQLSGPTDERLAQMQALGLNIIDLNIQRIYIYLNQQLTPAQIDELQILGVKLYLDSWIPPLANHPTGFILADLPIDKLETLAARNYIIKLDTAEVQSKPQL